MFEINVNINDWSLPHSILRSLSYLFVYVLPSSSCPSFRSAQPYRSSCCSCCTLPSSPTCTDNVRHRFTDLPSYLCYSFCTRPTIGRSNTIFSITLGRGMAPPDRAVSAFMTRFFRLCVYCTFTVSINPSFYLLLASWPLTYISIYWETLPHKPHFIFSCSWNDAHPNLRR